MRWTKTRILALQLGAPATMAVIFHLWGDMPLGWMLLAFLVGLPLFGLMTAPDNSPGRLADFLGTVLLGASIAAVGFAVEAGFTPLSAVFLVMAAAGTALSVILIRKGASDA